MNVVNSPIHGKNEKKKIRMGLRIYFVDTFIPLNFIIGVVR